MWNNYPESQPTDIGYYYTLYYNEEQKAPFLKAFWWNGKEWTFRFKPQVEAYMPESRNDYYCPCMIWANENVKDGSIPTPRHQQGLNQSGS